MEMKEAEEARWFTNALLKVWNEAEAPDEDFMETVFWAAVTRNKERMEHILAEMNIDW